MVINVKPKNNGVSKKLVDSRGFIFQCIPVFEHDMSKKGWRLNWSSCIITKDQCSFMPEIVRVLCNEESWISSDEMLSRIDKYDSFLLAGQQHLESMERNQEKISARWRKFVFVSFETLWIDENGKHRIPRFSFDKNQWRLGFDYFDQNFHNRYRLIRLKPS